MKTHRRMASAIRLHACNLLGSIKVPMGTIPMGVAFFYGIRGNLKCSAEVNSASAKIFAGGKNACTAQTRRPICDGAPCESARLLLR